MIDRQGGNIVFECDTCDETLTISAAAATTFEEAWALARRDGWRCKKIGNEWVHGCQRCGV